MSLVETEGKTPIGVGRRMVEKDAMSSVIEVLLIASAAGALGALEEVEGLMGAREERSRS